ncbi:hypothetical protein Tco_0329775, partial [Tanacetum coccineum]
MDAAISSSLDALYFTSKVWRKSPPSTIVFPSNTTFGAFIRSLSVLDLSVNSKGSLNREWVVLPASKSRDAMPDEATAKTIFPWDRSELIIVLQRNVSQYHRDRRRIR